MSDKTSLTPEQRIILAKLNGHTTLPVQSLRVAPAKRQTAWSQRRIKHGIILWIMRLGNFSMADITDTQREKLVRNGGKFPIRYITEMCIDFDKLVGPDFLMHIKAEPTGVYRFRLEQLIERYRVR